MDQRVLIIIAVILVLAAFIGIVVLIYVIRQPYRLMKRRRRGVTINNGANVENGQLQANTSGLGLITDSMGTVLVSGNLNVRNEIFIVRLTGQSSGHEFVVPVDQYAVLGRACGLEDAHFFPVTASPYVSRTQCMISVENGALYISDQSSFHNTLLNNRNIMGKTQLNTNDVLSFAGAEAFYVSVSRADSRQSITLSGRVHGKVR